MRALYDSLYRSYPVAALLLWEPKWEGEAPFSTRAWDICPPVRHSHRRRKPPDAAASDRQQWLGPSGIDRFGASAPGGAVMEKFGISAERVVEVARRLS